MNLKQVEEIVGRDSEGGSGKDVDGHKDALKEEPDKRGFDSAAALQVFLNRIPISSIPGISSVDSVLELKTGDRVRDAIRLLYENDVYGALVSVGSETNETLRGLSDRYIGFVELASMVLWSLEELHRNQRKHEGIDVHPIVYDDFFSMLEQNPQIGQTKVGELAKSFLWQPFFPVQMDDTLFHVLLLLSKHRVQVLPVVEKSGSQVIGFLTQNAVIQLLLRSSGLDWFDSLADRAISEFRFEHEKHASRVYGDQSIAEALHVLWEHQIAAIAVVDRGTKRIIGSLSGANVHLLLGTNDIFSCRKDLTVKEFIHMETRKSDPDPTIEHGLAALILAGSLRLRNGYIPTMDSPLLAKKTDTLKKAMEKLSEATGSCIFLADDYEETTGIVTLRDIIIQFAPPGMDSRIDGGGFFESSLEQTGCRVENGTMVL